MSKKNKSGKNKQIAKEARTRSFTGASFGNMTDIGQSFSLNADIQAGLRTLRYRCRQLSQNNSYAAKAVSLWANNIVGPKGVELRVQSKKTNGKLDKNANDLIETQWTQWCKHGNCDVTGQMSFTKIQELVIKAMAKDGEAFLVKRRGTEYGSWGFQLEVFQIDQLDDSYYTTMQNGNIVFQGVEVNKHLKPQAYWLWTRNIQDPMLRQQNDNQRIRIPAEDCIHIVDRQAAGQIRGYPWLATSLLSLHHIDTYKLTELETARVASLRSVFYTLPPNPEGLSEEDMDVINSQINRKLTSGSIEVLPEGMYIKFNDWSVPNTEMPDFVKCQLKGIAAGLDLNYSSLSNDLEGLTFSNSKLGALAEQDSYQQKQQWFIDCFVNLVYEDWLGTQMLRGKIALPLSKIDKYTNASWQARSWQSVNQMETARAAQIYVGLGLKSKQTICTEMGIDYSTQISQIAAEEAELSDLGIMLGSPLDIAKVEVLQDAVENKETSADKEE
jgi:lambda family phage portal protein